MKESSGIIKPIDQVEVRRIVAGQAITDLASCVKELVDNALDAGATTIQIKLFNQGFDAIEVSDNGTGVAPENRPLLAEKHATSKLRVFSDLFEEGNSTLGFRGEALFCLANISESLCVTTRYEDEPVGKKLWYDKDGKLDESKTSEAARSVGTTVTVSKLYHSLPVRRVDMKKRLKSQRSRLIKILQGYAILTVGTRFNVIDVNEGKKGVKKIETKLATSASKSLRQTVSSVLGVKFLSGLCEINIDISQCFTHLGNAEDDEVASDPCTQLWTITGLVSNAPSTTNSSAARDLQFFSVNGRPVELPKVSRVLSDAWRAFDSSDSKRPACILQLSLPNREFDVNLSPDKREVLLSSERKICEKLNESLNEIWTQSSATFRESEVEDMSNKQHRKRTLQQSIDEHLSQESVEGRIQTKSKRSNIDQVENVTLTETTPPLLMQSSTLQTLPIQKTEAGSKLASDDYNFKVVTPADSKPNLITQSSPESCLVEQVKTKTRYCIAGNSDHSIPSAKNKSIYKVSSNIKSSAVLQSFALKGEKSYTENSGKNTSAEIICRSTLQSETKEWERVKASFNSHSMKAQKTDIFEAQKTDMVEFELNMYSVDSSDSDEIKNDQSNSERKEQYSITSVHNNDYGQSNNHRALENNERQDDVNDDNNYKKCKILINKNMDISANDDAKKNLNDADVSMKRKDHEVDVDFPLGKPKTSAVVWDHYRVDNIRYAFREAKKLKRKLYNKLTIDQETSNRPGSVIETLSYDENSGNIEARIKRVDITVSKDEFKHMDIIGQFNLGFILAKCRKNHLWILDQHACDERFNFERFCKTTIIHEQRLIAPLPLELSPSEEDCILDNMNIFEKNGFRLHYDESKPPRHRVSLVAIPHSGSGRDGQKAVQFGKEDVGAILYMLGAEGSSSSNGYLASGGTGVDGKGVFGNNAVRRYAGTEVSQNTSSNKGVNDTLIRLPKAVAMFASRACRASVMIGKALSKKQMSTLVSKMEHVDLPWSCAHGRPTMRHVKDIRDVLIDDAKVDIHESNPFEIFTQECDEM